MPVVYADAVFLENLAIDYLLLLAAARVSGTPAPRRRILLGAAAGAVYALGCALAPDSWLSSMAVKLAVGLLMAAAVFGLRPRLLRGALVFLALSAAFAGAVMAACLVNGREVDLTSGVSFGTLLGAFVLFYILFSAAFRALARHRTRAEIGRLRIAYRGRCVTVPALLDTGNGLREPLSGLPVTVCSLEALAPLFEPRVLRVLREEPDPARAVELLGDMGVYAFLLVPYRALGTAGGLLPAFRPDSARMGPRELGTLIAVDARGLCQGSGYCAVTAA